MAGLIRQTEAEIYMQPDNEMEMPEAVANLENDAAPTKQVGVSEHVHIACRYCCEELPGRHPPSQDNLVAEGAGG